LRRSDDEEGEERDEGGGEQGDEVEMKGGRKR
jgi:hypothetical protein